MMAHFSKEELELIQEEIPCGRMARVDEIAQAALFLASENASYITGQVLGINGGMYC
jgi:3-oxoacyl-[acyl-carrier protein] reductase